MSLMLIGLMGVSLSLATVAVAQDAGAETDSTAPAAASAGDESASDLAFPHGGPGRDVREGRAHEHIAQRVLEAAANKNMVRANPWLRKNTAPAAEKTVMPEVNRLGAGSWKWPYWGTKRH